MLARPRSHHFALCSGANRLAVAVVVMPPTAGRVTKQFATNADVVVRLNFAQAFSVFDPRCIPAAALRDIRTGSLAAFGKHLRGLVTGHRILREHTVGYLVNAYFIACT